MDMMKCGEVRSTLTAIFISIASILSFSVLIIICKFICSFGIPLSLNNGHQKISKYLNYFAIIYSMMTLIMMIFIIAFVMDICMNGLTTNYKIILNVFYVIQTISTIFIWFKWLQFLSSKSKSMKLSKITVYGFTFLTIVIFSISVFICLMPLMIFNINMWGINIFSILVIIDAVLLILLMLIVAILFGCNLIRTFKNIHSEMDAIPQIFRVTILFFSCLIISYINIIIITIFDHSIIIKTMYGEFVSYYARIFNIFYNFLCIIGAYQQFDKLYNKLCGNCIDEWLIKKSKTKMSIQNSETISSDATTLQIEINPV